MSNSASARESAELRKEISPEIFLLDPNSKYPTLNSHERFTAEYDWTDAVRVAAGVVFYQSGDLRRTTDIGSNDSVYLEAQYNF